MFVPGVARAEGYFFGGAGLGYLQSGLELNATKSDFRGSSYFLTTGLVMGGGQNGSMGFLVKGEYGRGQTRNTLASNTYMEMADTSFMAAKAGVMFGNLTFGAGYRMTNLKVKSLSTTTGLATTKHDDATPLYFISYTVPNPRLVRTEVELQYISGKLGPVEFNEISLSLSLSLTNNSN